MTALGAAVGAALLAAVLYAAIQEVSPVFALTLSVAAAAAILLRLSTAMQNIVQGIAELAQRTGGAAFVSLARCAGILLLTDYVRALCEEAGAQSLAWCTSFAGRCLVLAAAWPLLSEVCRRLWEITG